MSRTIHADGRTVTVPDDATPEEVNQIFGPAPKNTPPAALSGPIGPAPIPAGLQGRAQPVIAPAGPVANKGLGTAWDTLSESGSHLVNAIRGPNSALTAPATPAEQQEFGGQDLSGAGARLSLAAKRMFVDPSVRNFQAGDAARQAGDYGGAITNYAQALPVVGPMEKQAVETAQTKGALPAMAGILTDLGIAKAVGNVADVAAAPARVGQAMQDSGLGRINKYLGAGPKDTMNGANPARAVINQVQGVPLSRGGLSSQIDAAAPRVGQQLGNVIQAADTSPTASPITAAQVAPSVDNPIFDRAGQVAGPGGNKNTGPLNTLLDSYNETAPGATAPIYGPNAPATVLPSDLWKTIRNIDSNTKFSTDPEVEGVNEVNRGIRGGLRQQLETADPNIKPLSQRYGDIRAAQDVLERKPNANSGIPLSLSHAVGRTLNAAPVQVGLGKMANAVGGGVSAVGKVLNPANTPGNIGNAAVVGSLGSSNRVVDQNTAPDQEEVAQPEGNQGQNNASGNLQDQQHVNEATTPAVAAPTLKPIDRGTAESYYDQAGGDPDAARELAAKDGYTF